MTRLKDLQPGDEFEYVYTVPVYRQGKFLVLDTAGNYLRPAAKIASRFIFSYATKKVVNHYVELEVIKKEATVKSQKQMGHFIGWKFGVPVRILNIRGAEIYPLTYLISESEKYFEVLSVAGGLEVFSKDNRSYELIPYKYGNIMNPRYPVCSSPDKTAFCNAMNCMTGLDSTGDVLKEYPTAKLVLEDGTEIKLSTETIEALRQQFGG